MSRKRFFRCIFLFLLLELLGFSFAAITGHAQTLPAAKASATTVLFDGGVGGGFGSVPFFEVGGGIERRIGKHFEIQAAFEYTPPFGNLLGPQKAGTVENVNGLLWATHKVAVYGGFRASQEYLDGIVKAPNYFVAGLVIRDRWNADMPGRLYLTYEEENGGCVWSTSQVVDTCPITASRLRGGNVNQEFRMTSHIRLIVLAGIYSVGQQVNPFSHGSTGYQRTFATEGLFRIRYTFGKQSNALY